MGVNGHFIFLIVFLLAFVTMSAIGFVRLARGGRIASSILVLVCAGVFCISTYFAATM